MPDPASRLAARGNAESETLGTDADPVRCMVCMKEHDALGTPAAVEPNSVENVTTVPSACLNTGTVPLIRRVETSENLVLVRYSVSLYISVET